MPEHSVDLKLEQRIISKECDEKHGDFPIWKNQKTKQRNRSIGECAGRQADFDSDGKQSDPGHRGNRIGGKGNQ